MLCGSFPIPSRVVLNRAVLVSQKLEAVQSDCTLPSLAAVRKQVLNMLARFGTRKRSAGKELTLLCATEDVRFHASAVVHTIQRLSELHMLAFEYVPCVSIVHM